MGLGEVVGNGKTEDSIDDQGGVTRSTSANSRVSVVATYPIRARHTITVGSQVFYTADEIKSFRTLGLEPSACKSSQLPLRC